MNDTSPAPTESPLRIFSSYLIALHEMGRLSASELADWQASVASSLGVPVHASADA